MNNVTVCQYYHDTSGETADQRASANSSHTVGNGFCKFIDGHTADNCRNNSKTKEKSRNLVKIPSPLNGSICKKNNGNQQCHQNQFLSDSERMQRFIQFQFISFSVITFSTLSSFLVITIFCTKIDEYLIERSQCKSCSCNGWIRRGCLVVL